MKIPPPQTLKPMYHYVLRLPLRGWSQIQGVVKMGLSVLLLKVPDVYKTFDPAFFSPLLTRKKNTEFYVLGLYQKLQ